MFYQEIRSIKEIGEEVVSRSCTDAHIQKCSDSNQCQLCYTELQGIGFEGDEIEGLHFKSE